MSMKDRHAGVLSCTEAVDAMGKGADRLTDRSRREPPSPLWSRSHLSLRDSL